MSTDTPRDGDTGIAVRGLTKRFWVYERAVQALAEVDLDIRSGEFFCIVGPSGCGKMTFLRILAGARGADRREFRGGPRRRA